MAATDTLAWYVVYSKAHKEAFAAAHLRLKGIEVFFPQLLLPDYLHHHRRVVPLFPGYLFVRIDLATRFYDVLWSPGVQRFVGANGMPATSLDDDIVALLRQQTTPDGIVRARSSLRIGQHVRIIDGPFEGVAAIIERPPDARGRVKVLLELLSRKVVKARVPLASLEGHWLVESAAGRQ